MNEWLYALTDFDDRDCDDNELTDEIDDQPRIIEIPYWYPTRKN